MSLTGSAPIPLWEFIDDAVLILLFTTIGDLAVSIEFFNVAFSFDFAVNTAPPVGAGVECAAYGVADGADANCVGCGTALEPSDGALGFSLVAV